MAFERPTSPRQFWARKPNNQPTVDLGGLLCPQMDTMLQKQQQKCIHLGHDAGDLKMKTRGLQTANLAKAVSSPKSQQSTYCGLLRMNSPKCRCGAAEGTKEVRLIVEMDGSKVAIGWILAHFYSAAKNFINENPTITVLCCADAWTRPAISNTSRSAIFGEKIGSRLLQMTAQWKPFCKKSSHYFPGLPVGFFLHCLRDMAILFMLFEGHCTACVDSLQFPSNRKQPWSSFKCVFETFKSFKRVFETFNCFKRVFETFNCFKRVFETIFVSCFMWDRQEIARTK